MSGVMHDELAIEGIISKYFTIVGKRPEKDHVLYVVDEVGEGLGSVEERYVELYGELVSRGFYPMLRLHRGQLMLKVVKAPHARRRERTKAMALMIATLITVGLTGYELFRGFPAEVPPLLGALTFAAGLMLPLGLHELGHYLASRMSKVPVSLPYFIPAPPVQLGFLGTFGAVINMRWIPPSAASLAYIGLSGPIAGLLAAIPVAVFGIERSVLYVPKPGEEVGVLNVAPLIFIALMEKFARFEDGIVLLHPVAFAAYLVFMVTFLNLLPVGQLDGGHVVRALTSEKAHALIGWVTLGLMVLASAMVKVFMLFTLFVAAILMLTGGRHPGPAGPERAAPKHCIFAGVVYATLLTLTFPIPVGT